MRILSIVAAAALAVFTVPAASAAPVKEAAAQTRVVVTTNQRHYGRHHAYGHRNYWRRTCQTYWRHHRRITKCRRVRYWR